MQAIFRNGPADGAACVVSEPPRETLCVEVFAEDVERSAQPVPPGASFPTIESEAHGYRLDGMILTEAGKEAHTRMVIARYRFDENLNPQLAEQSVAVEAR